MSSYRLWAVAALWIFIYGCTKDKLEPNEPTPEEPPVEGELAFPDKDMRAVWMTTAWGLDWPLGDYNAESQKQRYLDYLDRFEELHINAIFFQVKAMGDAFHDSEYEPWSASITGTRGMDPGYDILQFMIDEAHGRGIEFHAWMNPYRIATRANAATPYPALHPSVDPDWVVSHEKIQIYNPALPEVRQRLAAIVNELITRYPVDGIHFDDYFYPDPSSAGTMQSDADDYATYGAGHSTIESFRRDNVDKAIEAVYQTIVDTKPEVIFSVSPAASGAYNLNTLYADVAKWCREGWMDLLIPQLYQEIGNPFNDFQANLGWWSQYSYDVPMLIGHGFYRFGDPAAPSAFQTTTELARQFDLTDRNQKVVGNAQYSARYILENRIQITDRLAQRYKELAVMPMLGREVAPAPSTPQQVRIDGNNLVWNTAGDARSVVYYFSDLDATGVVYAITDQSSVPIGDAGHYCVAALNADNQESQPSETVENE